MPPVPTRHRPCLLLSLLLMSATVHAGDRPTGRPFATRSEVLARHGMAATSQPLATLAALDILKAGGSAVDGWFALHQRFGKLPMTQVLAPAIGYARDGFPVSEVIASYWAMAEKKLAGFDGFRKTFLPGGRAPRKGEIFRNPDLARSYERLAAGGRDVFYRGEMAREVDATLRRVGGFLRFEDLAAHRSEWVEPVSTRYRGHDVWELPPNGQGFAALQILNLLEGYDLARLSFGSPEVLHTFVEAKKLAFADLARHCADPAFTKIPLGDLISKPYAAERRKLIRPDRVMQTAEGGVPSGGDTIYLAVADRDGNMVSLIQSNYRGMGSGLVPDGLGFGLQDRGELFDLTPGRPNSYAPAKRPFHTIIPAFVTKDEKPFLAFGVMGGDVQPQMHVQILMNLLDFGMNLQEAGDAPRILHRGSSGPTSGVLTDGGTVALETGFAAGTAAALEKLGHRIAPAPGEFGGYQAVGFDAARGVFIGASESRKDGMAAGY